MLSEKSHIELVDNNNWLEQERKRESRISAWDFDDAKKLRYQHEEDCDVKDNAQYHANKHSRRKDYSARAIENDNKASAGMWLVLDIILLLFYIFMITIADDFSTSLFVVAMLILFLGINPGIFIWLGVKKRMPSANYYRALFITSLFFAIPGLIITILILLEV